MNRFIELNIDTDIVLDQFKSILTEINSFESTGINQFSLGGAWESGNASVVAEKVNEINDSIIKIKNIINDLQKKVNSYVTNVIQSDTVTFTGNNGNSTGGTGAESK